MASPLGKDWQLSDTALFAVTQCATTAADITNQLQFSSPLNPDMAPEP